MKNLKKPTRAQKEKMTKKNLDWTQWLIVSQNKETFIIENKETKEHKELNQP